MKSHKHLVALCLACLMPQRLDQRDVGVLKLRVLTNQYNDHILLMVIKPGSGERERGRKGGREEGREEGRKEWRKGGRRGGRKGEGNEHKKVCGRAHTR